jgi:hypothetical protein
VSLSNCVLKPAINAEDASIVTSIREEVALTPQNLRDVVERLNVRWNMSMTIKQLKNFLKKTEVQLASLS